jgi:hypothetical protein
MSCEDARKHIGDNLGKYNTLRTYLDPLYATLGKEGDNAEAVKWRASNLIEFVDVYLSDHSKEIPSSVGGVNDIDQAGLYYMFISKQIALLASDFVDKRETLDDETLETQYYSKFDLLEDDLEPSRFRHICNVYSVLNRAWNPYNNLYDYISGNGNHPLILFLINTDGRIHHRKIYCKT